MSKAPLHPIQLQTIHVKRLVAEVAEPLAGLPDQLDMPFRMEHGHSHFDEDDSMISVGIRGGVGKRNEDGTLATPFLVEAELFGLFKVDTSQFDVADLDRWAVVNAPLILVPFLREHVYGISHRAGIHEVIIPLYTLPPLGGGRPRQGDLAPAAPKP